MRPMSKYTLESYNDIVTIPKSSYKRRDTNPSPPMAFNVPSTTHTPLLPAPAKTPSLPNTFDFNDPDFTSPLWIDMTQHTPPASDSIDTPKQSENTSFLQPNLQHADQDTFMIDDTISSGDNLPTLPQFELPHVTLDNYQETAAMKAAILGTCTITSSHSTALYIR